MNWSTQRQGEDIEGPRWAQRTGIKGNSKKATSDLCCHNHCSCEQFNGSLSKQFLHPLVLE